MTGRLEGKVALVSGAAQGQGEAEARRFVAEGARVVIGDLADDKGSAVADSLGDAVRFVHLDVTDPEQWASAVAIAEESFGPVQVLVNNAGVLVFGPLQTLTAAQMQTSLEVNLMGPFHGMQAVYASMKAAGGGSIVNISSFGGLTGLPLLGAYVASKFAVRGLTKTAAIDFARANIRVNSVHPGGVNTPMTQNPDGSSTDDSAYNHTLPIKRHATVDEIASMVLFLASDESSYCTGSEFVIDGGGLAGIHNLMTG
ncbi:MAG TPA: glucose 1-dehydrogenase [Acidimicrobiales bacterium]|nr:glucose 1-dehydrogenase [Acidimicrobiales bacterium]